LALRRGQARQGIKTTTKFESAHALKILTLEKHLQPQARIQAARLQHRCAVGVALQALCSGQHIIKIRQKKQTGRAPQQTGGVSHHFACCAPPA
jgi:hypothetical protein